MAKILVVDDEKLLRDLLAEELQDMDHSVIQAEDGNVALAIIKKTKPDLVISDINMPNMDGIELLQALHAEAPELAATPFIFLTAMGNREDIIVAKNLGVDDYLSKPLDFELLKATLQARLGAIKRTDLAISEKFKNFYQRIEEVAGEQIDQKDMSIDDIFDRYLKYAKQAKQVLPGALNLNQASYSFKRIEEAEVIAFSLASICPNPETTGVGLLELLVNAVEHGNLCIGYEEKSALLKSKKYSEEIERRLNLTNYKAREVYVDFRREGKKGVFKITDSGDGFDWQKYIEFDPARLSHQHGRGIAMASSLCFASLEYQGNGSCVVASVELD